MQSTVMWNDENWNTISTSLICASFKSRVTLMQVEAGRLLQRELKWGRLWKACCRMCARPTGWGRSSLLLLLAPIRRDYRRSPAPIMLCSLHTGHISVCMKKLTHIYTHAYSAKQTGAASLKGHFERFSDIKRNKGTSPPWCMDL